MLARPFRFLILLCSFFVVSIFFNGLFFAQNLRINELVQSNTLLFDDNYDLPDGWIELYNDSEDSINIKNWVISQEKSCEKGYIITTQNYDLFTGGTWKTKGDSIIPPKGFYLLYCDEINTGIHTNFSLSLKKNAALYLYNPNCELIDAVEKIPALITPNVAYGRISGNDTSWAWLSQSTPGKKNGISVASENAPLVHFSRAGGSFTAAFSLILSTEASAYPPPIYYTLDGSEPTEDSPLYMAPIPISQTTVVRAKVVSDLYFSAIPQSNSYLFLDRNIQLPIVSMTLNPDYIADEEIGIYIKGTTSYSGCWGDSGNYWGNRTRIANIEYFSNINQASVLNQQAHIRISGGCSRFYDQKSFAIKTQKRLLDNRFEYPLFQEKPAITEYQSFLLRSSGNDTEHTMLRDALLQQLLGGKVDLDYQAYQPAVLYINGDYWGLFNLRERSNEIFVESNYGLEEEEFDMVENWRNTVVGNRTDLDKLLLDIDESQSLTYADVANQVDIPELINYLLLQTFVCNIDFPINNVMMWRKKDNGKWRFLVKDLDLSSNFNGIGPEIKYLNFLTQTGDFLPWSYDERSGRLFKYLLTEDAFSQLFIDKAIVYLGTYFSANTTQALLDSLSGNIATEMPYHRQKWSNAQDWQESLSDMRNFFLRRPSYLYQEITDFYGLGDTIATTITTSVSQASLYMNDVPIYKNNFDGKLYAGRPIFLENKSREGMWELTYFDTATADSVNVHSMSANFQFTPQANWKDITCTFGDFVNNTMEYAMNEPDIDPSCIYSNSSLLNIACESVTQVEVYDLLGRIVVSDRQPIHATYSLPSGSYIVKLMFPDRVSTQKIMVSSRF